MAEKKQGPPRRRAPQRAYTSVRGEFGCSYGTSPRVHAVAPFLLPTQTIAAMPTLARKCTKGRPTPSHKKADWPAGSIRLQCASSVE